MNRRVCIIRSNPVDPDSRVEKEAYSLAVAGFDVQILAWDRNSDHAPEEERIVIKGVPIPITRLGYKASFGEGFKNLRPYLGFQFCMRRWLRTNRGSFDIIHACDFDTAFFSIGVAKAMRKKFVFDIFDFLCGEPKSLFQRIINKAQLRIIDRADATIICTEARRRQIAGAKPKRLVVIENTPPLVYMDECEKGFVEPSVRVKVAYVGILQDYRLLPEIIDHFSNDHTVEFHAGGFGKYESLFCEAAENNENIFFYGKLKYDDTLRLERDCDIMLAIYDPSLENHRFAAPNKFYEALMLGKPVIMVKGTGMSDVVSEYDLGCLIEYSEESFANGLKQLISRRDKWPEISQRSKDLYSASYNWDVMASRLNSLYTSLSQA